MDSPWRVNMLSANMLWHDDVDIRNEVVEDCLHPTGDTSPGTKFSDDDMTRPYLSYPGYQCDVSALWTSEPAIEPHPKASTAEVGHDASECVDSVFHPRPSQSATDESRMDTTFDTSGFLWPMDFEGQTSMLYANVDANDVFHAPRPEPGWSGDDSSQQLDNLEGDTTPFSNETAENSPIGSCSLVNRLDTTSHRSAELEEAIICATDDLGQDKRDRRARLRGCHNEVEKNYRNRLNKDFQLLFDALAECVDESDLVSTTLTKGTARTRSKGSILRLAKRRLLALHTENRFMARELKATRRNWMESRSGHVFRSCESM